MKEKISIQTLTPIHVGSGDELLPGTEYISFSKETAVSVVEPSKVLNIIGEENIHQWISLIGKNDTNLLNDLLKVRKPNIKAEDVANRIIKTIDSTPSREKIKAQIHLGSPSVPSIPGSSLKGSIRTAILNYLIKQNPRFAANEKNLGRERHGRMSYNDANIQANYLAPKRGKNFRVDPQKDLLRLLRIGDAYFNTQTELHKTKVVNEYRNGWDEKKQLSSYFECIPAESATTFDISISEDLKKAMFNNRQLDTQPDFPAYSIPSLFRLLNKYTLFLIDKEITFWENEDNPLALEDYLEHLQELKTIGTNCQDSECIIRVGAGSGWDFMTGAWAMDKDVYGDYILSERTWGKLKNSLRRGKYSNDVTFPKTRKLIRKGIPFGFVKLSKI